MKKRRQRLKTLFMAFVMSGALLWGGKTAHAAGDVSKDAWYYDAVNYVMDQKYMNGISAKDFDPLGNLTRAQFVQVLYNVEGCPGVVIGGGCYFEDNKDTKSWYYDAVLWAKGDCIANGVDSYSFGVDHLITREQIATMLYNYAIRSGEYKTTIDNSALAGFPDKDKVSTWADEALKWAVGNGIINGKSGDKGNVLDPQGKATRAECAQMIMNLKKKAGIEVPTYPEKFDLRDVIEIPVEDQGHFGLCWDFASMKCVETNLALTKGITCNFSEIHVGYMMSDVISPYLSKLEEFYLRTYDDGGFFEEWLKYNLAFHGFMADAELEYRVYDAEEYRQFGEKELVPLNVSKVKRFPIHAYDTQGHVSEVTVENVKRQVKEHIMKYGAIYVGVLVFGEETYLYNTCMGGNHAMAIIGWDDTIPKEKFAHDGYSPKKDGGYIVLNSWGTEVCDQGIMYISYEDYNVHTELWGVVSTDDENLIDLNQEGDVGLLEAIQKKYPEWLIDKDGKQYINPTLTEVYQELDLSGCGITSLEGIDELAIFENCTSINLSDNEIVDLTPLKSAKLNRVCKLYLNNNKITDITELTSLKGISDLELDNNRITDVSALASMKNLYRLSVKNNQVKDVTCLKDCGNLRTLYLDGNKKVTGYGELKGLYELGLSDCGLNKIENLNYDMNVLDLSRNPIGDQIGSIKLYAINTLILQECGLKSAPEVTSDVYLDLSGNPDIEDFSALNGQRINYLILANCNISDGGIFPTDWAVVNLDLSGNAGIRNLGRLSKSVESIVLKNCGITDVSVLGDKRWKSVDLSENVGLYGELRADKLTLEKCGLDDQFDFFGNNEIKLLYIKGNAVSFKHILDSVKFDFISCDPITVEELQLLTSGENDDVAVEADVYATMNIPASAKDQTLQFLPVIRHFLTDRRQQCVISEGKDIEYNSYLLTGKMQGDHAQIKVDLSYTFRLSDWMIDDGTVEDWMTKYIPVNYKFILDIQVVDQLKAESIIVHTDRIYDKYYLVGDKIDPSMVKVEKFYEGGYSEFVSDFEIAGPENLEFGENKYLVKLGDLETDFTVEAGVKILFETMDVYTAFRNSFCMGLFDIDDETKMIVMRQFGKEEIENGLYYAIPSSMIWDLEKVKGWVSFRELRIWYDGHKIDEKDLEVLKSVSYMGPLVPKPHMTIYSCNGEKLEDMIVKQDIFEVEQGILNDSKTPIYDDLDLGDEMEPELLEAQDDTTDLNAVEDILNVADVDASEVTEVTTEEITTEEDNHEEISLEESDKDSTFEVTESTTEEIELEEIIKDESDIEENSTAESDMDENNIDDNDIEKTDIEEQNENIDEEISEVTEVTTEEITTEEINHEEIIPEEINNKSEENCA